MTTSYDTFKKTESYVEGTVKELVAHNIKALQGLSDLMTLQKH